LSSNQSTAERANNKTKTKTKTKQKQKQKTKKTKTKTKAREVRGPFSLLSFLFYR
jgi:hypothetical protein